MSYLPSFVPRWVTLVLKTTLFLLFLSAPLSSGVSSEKGLEARAAFNEAMILPYFSIFFFQRFVCLSEVSLIRLFRFLREGFSQAQSSERGYISDADH